MTSATLLPAGEFEGPRRFTDAEGRRWTVTEDCIPAADWTAADHEGFAAGYGVGWLHFRGGETWKRLRLFPRHWRTCSDVELDRLCRRARMFEMGVDGGST